MATAQQQQAIIDAIKQQSPEAAQAPPALLAGYADAITSKDPRDAIKKMAALQQQYPQYITNESIWKNPGFIAGLAALTGGVASAALPALLGSGAAGGGLAATVPGAEGGAAASVVSATAPTVAGAASTGFGAALKAALPSIIGAGATVGGSAIAAHGNTEAAKTQAAATEKAAQIQADQLDRALAQAKYIYQTQRADLSGYRSGGNDALGALSFGLGLPAPAFDAPPVDPSIANPPPTTGVAPGAVDAKGNPLPGAANAPYVTPPTPAQQMTGSGNVKIQDPSTGLVHLIPPDQVAAAKQAGGVLV